MNSVGNLSTSDIEFGCLVQGGGCVIVGQMNGVSTFRAGV